jgi:HTH-type transcriptional regulator/antitoxin HigA
LKPLNVKTDAQLITPEYLALIRAFPPRPIRDDDEHRRAIEVVNGLLDRPALTSDEEDYLDVLGLLVADYEDSLYEHPEFAPVDRLRHLMGEHVLTQAELARRTGIAVTSLSDILNGVRRISPRVRAKLAECFGVSSSFFA